MNLKALLLLAALWLAPLSALHAADAPERWPAIKANAWYAAQPWLVGCDFLSSTAINNPQMRNYTFIQATARTCGQIGYPRPGEKFGTLTGAPIVEKLMGYASIEEIGQCERVAKLLIIAEKEELMDNRQHAILAYEQATGIKKLVTIKGIKHYGIYAENGQEAQQVALDWFGEHLKTQTP